MLTYATATGIHSVSFRLRIPRLVVPRSIHSDDPFVGRWVYPARRFDQHTLVPVSRNGKFKDGTNEFQVATNCDPQQSGIPTYH